MTGVTLLVSLEVEIKTKLNTRRVTRWQRADLFEANISANKISLPRGQSYTEILASNKSALRRIASPLAFTFVSEIIVFVLLCFVSYLAVMLTFNNVLFVGR